MRDAYGNLILGAHSQKDYEQRLKKAGRSATSLTEPFIIMIAHMDHPGFVVTQIKPSPQGSQLEAEWLGGSPVSHLIGHKIWVTPRQPQTPLTQPTFYEGTITEFTLRPHGKSIHTLKIQMNQNLPPLQYFGSFKFESFVWQQPNSDLIYTQAADDLAGVYAACSSWIKLFKKYKKAPSSVVLISRAEEIGFIGTLQHLKKYHRQPFKNCVVLSLETSRTLPGAEIGKGPIVRLGDRMTVFDTRLTQALHELAEKILPQQYSRRIMDGGACEASAAAAYGIPVFAISIPLGNYHNQQWDGDQSPGPEYVHQKDLQGMSLLIEHILHSKTWKSLMKDPFRQRRQGFVKSVSLSAAFKF
jgi:endoglucanase